MYLYNSLSHKKELFVPNNPDLVKMYTCGPTVYHYAHIGNLRTYIMEDVLEKALRYTMLNTVVGLTYQRMTGFNMMTFLTVSESSFGQVLTT